MYLPKKIWSQEVKKKVRSLGMLTLYAGSVIGCNVATSAESPTATPIVIAEQIAEPTATNLPATATIEPATATTVPPTATATLVPPTATPTDPPPTATPTELPPTATPEPSGQYVDGTYLGDAVAADRWGDMQVRAVIEGGELVNVEIVAYPSSTRRSDEITRAALPSLISEAIANQSADVDIVTRATDSSVAFIESLETALEDAAIGSDG